MFVPSFHCDNTNKVIAKQSIGLLQLDRIMVSHWNSSRPTHHSHVGASYWQHISGMRHATYPQVVTFKLCFFHLICLQRCFHSMASVWCFHYPSQLLILLRDKWERCRLSLVVSDFQLFLQLVFLISDDCYTCSLKCSDSKLGGASASVLPGLSSYYI